MKIITLIIALFVTPAFAGWFGPDNYDDCVLENIKPGIDGAAVRAIKRSCRNKFPLKKAPAEKKRIALRNYLRWSFLT